MQEATHLSFKPVKHAFLWRRIGISIGGIVILAGAISVASTIFDGRAAIAFIILALLAAYAVADGIKSYQKQSYIFGDNTIYFGAGTLFTDRQTELRFANITNVRVVKPFFEYHIFGTGKILIESAGSSGVEVEMQSIDTPYEVFQQIQKLLGKETFSLSYKKLLIQKQPAPLAVALEITGSVVAGAVALFFFIVGGSIPLAWLNIIPFALIGPIALLVLLGGGAYIYAMYQDRVRRTYYIYEDVVHYSKGFLTKEEAFIPVANLANASLTQNIIDKLLNLHDVIVSCQGQGSEIAFKNLESGQEVERVLDDLISRTQPVADVDGAAKAGKEPNKSAAAEASQSPKGEDVAQQTFKMSMSRAMLNYVLIYPFLLIVPPILIIILVRQYIVATRTEFRLTSGGVASHYTFLSTKNVEFSRDKITGLVVKRNPLDRWLGTCTVSFWSIGSGSTVDFLYIPYDNKLEPLMRAKAGIVDDKELETIKPQFSVGNMLKAHLVIATISAALILTSALAAYWLNSQLLALAIVLLAVYAVVAIILYRRYHRASLRLGQHTVTVKVGILSRRHYYARHDNIKDITMVNYPFSRLGKVQFNIAGEQAIDNGQGQKTTLPNQFNLGYLPDVASAVAGDNQLLDTVLLQKPDPKTYTQLRQSPQPPIKRRHAQPSLKNSLAGMIPLHIIIFPLLPLLPLSILFRRYWLRHTHYVIEDSRVVKRRGVVYKKQTSVLFARLDYTKTGQDFLNKVFKNGNLYLYTTGSSSAELELTNMPGHLEFSRALKAQHKGANTA